MPSDRSDMRGRLTPGRAIIGSEETRAETCARLGLDPAEVIATAIGTFERAREAHDHVVGNWSNATHLAAGDLFLAGIVFGTELKQ